MERLEYVHQRARHAYREYILAAMTIRVLEVRPGRWSYMIDGEFPGDLFDPTWGLTTFASQDEAGCAANDAVAARG